MANFRVNKNLQENYAEYYASKESEWRFIGASGKAENIVSICSSIRHDKIMEIGAGDGAVLSALASRKFGKHYYALEISHSGIEQILNKNISGLIKVELFDGYNILYENQSFDLAILSHVLEHVEYPRKLIYEAGRIADFVYVEVPLEDNLRLPKDFVFDEVGHINYYSYKTIRKLIQSCNFKVINQILVNRPKRSYLFQNRYRGLLSYYLKEYLLRISPTVAMLLFTYHTGLLFTHKSQSDKP